MALKQISKAAGSGLVWARLMRTVALVFLCLLPFNLEATAGIRFMPPGASIEGFFHKDRFGSGSIGGYPLDPKLLPRLKPYEGQYIKVVVNKSTQFINPGPLFLIELGKIERVEREWLPLEMRCRIASPSAPANAPLQLLLEIHNKGAKPIQIDPKSCRVLIKWPTKRSTPLDKEYIKRNYFWLNGVQSLYLTELPNLVNTIIAPTHDILEGNSVYQPLPSFVLGHRMHESGPIRVEPGQSAPLVIMLGEGLPKGPYELQVNYPAAKPGWFLFDLPSAENERVHAVPSNLKLITEKIQTEGEWTALQLRLTNPRPDKERKNPKWASRTIPQCDLAKHGQLWAGHLRGYTKEGHEVQLSYDELAGMATPSSRPDRRPRPTQEWTVVAIPKNGLQTTIRFRTRSYFSDAPLTRITCDLLTDRGLETFTLTDTFEDSAFQVPPPLGEMDNGLAVRIRTARKSYRPDQPLRAILQIVNQAGKRQCLQRESLFNILIDGKNVGSLHNYFIVGWTESEDINTPIELAVDVKPQDLAPGEHTLQVNYIGSNRDQKDVYGKVQTAIDKLAIAPCRFTVEASK